VKEEPLLHTPRSVAVDAALEAGRVLRSYFGTLDSVEFKGEIDVVTEADRVAEDAVIRRIVNAFPDHAILAEESGSTTGAGDTSERWLIDPLDGTTNFANAYPHFCVSIALERDNALQLGVIYVPMLDELFIAERGQGLTLNGEPVHVSRTGSLLNSVLSTGFKYDRQSRGDNIGPFTHFTFRTRAVRRDGSAAMDLCYVAAGRFDGYWEAGLNPWDAAAGALMVVEAGGRITDYRGNAFRIDGPDCIASNGLIHEDMISGLDAAAGKVTRS
jgi:myo-inositol-1(or 4)-monophosphatase